MELDLGAVRTFLAVVDDGHFTDAADRLGLTQQAVSKRVGRLESELGVSLLSRSRAGATLTADGAAFLPNARALISLADQATGMLRARHRALRIDALARDAAPIDTATGTSSTSPSPAPRRYIPGPSCGTGGTATRRCRCSSRTCGPATAPPPPGASGCPLRTAPFSRRARALAAHFRRRRALARLAGEISQLSPT